MSRFKSLVFIFVVALFIGATTSSADNHGDTQREAPPSPPMNLGEGKCGDAQRGNPPMMNSGEHRCGDAQRGNPPMMNSGEGRCGNDTKNVPVMRCGAGKCG